MNVEIRFRTLDPSNALREHAEDLAQRRLLRFRDKIESVVVRVLDVNGPRGGLDKVCQVSAQGALGPTAVREQGSDAYVVVARAIERLAAAIGRLDGRRRTHAPSATSGLYARAGEPRNAGPSAANKGGALRDEARGGFDAPQSSPRSRGASVPLSRWRTARGL